MSSPWSNFYGASVFFLLTRKIDCVTTESQVFSLKKIFFLNFKTSKEKYKLIISTKWLNWVVYIKLPEFFEITNQIIVYLKNKTKSLLETESWERFHDKSCAITVLWFSKSIFRPKFKAISSKTMFTFKHSEQQINKLEKDYFYRFAFTYGFGRLSISFKNIPESNLHAQFNFYYY